jgi:BirA family biotin operon repressor/biotin-[acetyl-CoA-carboxylase] ligase
MDDMPEEVKAKAASLNRSLCKFYSCETVLEAILKEFSKTYQMWQQDGNEAVLSLWKEMNCTLGKRVTVLDEDREVFSGKAVALDAEGALLVQNEAGREASFNFGEISIQYGK